MVDTSQSFTAGPEGSTYAALNRPDWLKVNVASINDALQEHRDDRINFGQIMDQSTQESSVLKSVGPTIGDEDTKVASVTAIEPAPAQTDAEIKTVATDERTQNLPSYGHVDALSPVGNLIDRRS